jgi:hypothetical protein
MRKHFCESDICEHRKLSSQRVAAGIRLCKFCDDGINGMKRIELKYLDYFNDWKCPPTSHDVVIKSSNCSTIEVHNSLKKNLRRADYFWLTENSFPYNILVECDENSHSGIDPSCEQKRLQEVYDQIVSNTRHVKPLAVIRFNPYNKKVDVPSCLK